MRTAAKGFAASALAALALAAAVAPAPVVAASPRTLVDFHRGGSIAGLNEHLVVRTDRRARLTVQASDAAKRFRIGPKTLRRLRSALNTAHFDTLRGTFKSEPPVADDFLYTVRYHGHTVRADGTAVPQRLAKAVGLLSQIVDQHR